ncbi:sugar phosphate isomerase/epimerase [Roseicella sp. DB1501]|uniref:sugar phosphate isomerase/epimerase family protein n=1 Tax=Roseicella sp. DB1501 TaxID=2730925 RepID=UPI0014908D71|nr:TIM barrel protein [Roseicella sp. DB1501]NOG70156.1 sugar phosphate isomerase/epimerase [Roseicella sp. DB1501]
MQPALALAHLTVLDLPPPAVLRVAAGAGCAAAGLRLLPVAPGAAGYPLQDDPALMRETLAAMAETGVAVADLEIVMLRPETEIAGFLPVLEAGARLGARHVLVAGYDPEPARLAASFAGFCQAAAGFGLTADLEFMPWTAVPDLAAAIRVVREAAQPNAGVLVDALHFDRSRSRVGDLAAVPRGWLHYWQLCDAPAAHPGTTEGLLHTAREERLFPGEGGLALAPLIRALPPELLVSLEIPTVTLARTMGPEERVRRAAAAARQAIAAARQG